MQINIGYYLRHGLFFSNKLINLHEDRLPYTHEEKNKQYIYQKNMSFSLPQLREKFIIRFPELLGIKNWWHKLINIKYQKGEFETDKFLLKIKLGERYRALMTLFGQAINFHNHIFTATEKYR